MKAYLLLLPISFLPAVAGILVTRPMWRIRQLPNEAIQGIGLVVMISVLIGCLVPLFLGDTGAVGCACILLSLFNLVILFFMLVPPLALSLADSSWKMQAKQ